MKERGLVYFLGLALALMSGASGTVSASVMACASNIANSVDGARVCQISTSNPANSNPETETTFVNREGFFTIGDWIFAGKVDSDGPADVGAPPGVQTTDIGFGASGINDTSGTWSINQSAFSTWANIMLLFKSAQDPSVGYLLFSTINALVADDVACTGIVCTGDWDSPFFNNGNAREVSHITAFVSDSSTAVPEPATLMLLGIGLLGMVRVGRWMA